MRENERRTLVKICGLKDADTIISMSGLPVDYIGFVFAPSKRQVTAAQAAELYSAVQAVPMRGGKPPRTAGVFVNPTIKELADTLAQVPLDVVQLHGQETPAFCLEVSQRFGVDVWRVLSIREENENAAADGRAAARLQSETAITAYEGVVSTILLDTAGGGTGRTFNWAKIPSYQAAARRCGLRMFVAGGLTPDNVAGLVSEYAPDGVDISSGVETDGVKDIRKIATFAERVNRS